MTTHPTAGAAHFDDLGTGYIDVDPVHADYHSLRLDRAAEALTSLQANARAYDFGCGAGHLIERLAQKGYSWSGCDPSREMVRLAKERTGAAIELGGIERFEAEVGSFDAVVALNVLPYMTDDEERRFLAHAAQVLRAGGLLLLSHTNKLFDLVSFNRYTVQFWRDELIPHIAAGPAEQERLVDRMRSLIVNPDLPTRSDTPGIGTQVSDRELVPKRRVDPFTWPKAVESAGFSFDHLRPFNLYPLPPLAIREEPVLDRTRLAVSSLDPTLATILSTQFQALFVKD